MNLAALQRRTACLLGVLVAAHLASFCGTAQAQSYNARLDVRGRPSKSASSALAGRSAYGRLPLSFEANRGQAAKDVRYVARGSGYRVALTSSVEARIALQRRIGSRVGMQKARELRMRLVSGAGRPAVSAMSALPGKANYLLGTDSRRWITNVPTFARVAYSSVYPGIDLAYYGSQSQLEYDFIVAPHADPARIALHFDGANTLKVSKKGELLVGMPGGSVKWRRPVVYQHVGGTRRSVAGRFVAKGRDEVAFAIGRYDHRQPLIIDPVLDYSTYLGGSGSDQAYALAVDASGNAYVTGTTTSPDFPHGGSAFTGASDAFVSKLDHTGSRLLYSTYIGGSGDTTGWSIAVDSAGDAYVGGDTTATDFPVLNGFGAVNAGGVDGFVARISTTGAGLVYSSFLGGSDTDTVQGIALGPNGNLFATGYTASTDFPAGTGHQTANAGGLDAFVARIDTAAAGVASLKYCSYLGGELDDRGFGITVDSAGRFYVTGDTTSTTFPVASPYQASLAGVQNAVVVAYSADGTQLLYSTYLGGGGSDSGFSIAVDGTRNAYVTGATDSTSFPIRSALQQTSGGAGDAFVAKLNTSVAGDASLVYSTFLGGTGDDAGRSIAVDVWGNAYVTGDTDGTFSPFSASAGFVAKVSANGSKLLFGTLIGGSGFQANLGIAVDWTGSAYVAGYTNSIDFPITPGPFQADLAGTLNSFVLKLPTFTKLDFNHDNQADLLFQNAADGRLVYWTMAGDREIRYGFLSPGTAGANMNMVAAADLDGDNNTDLIFQNAMTGDLTYWLMNGRVQSSTGSITPVSPGTNWHLIGTGDFNRDGHTDFLFQNSLTGDMYIWNMNGTRMVSGNYVSPKNPGTGWKVVAVGDLNGDDQPDIMFQNTTTGNVYVWYMHGSAMYAGGFLNPANQGAGWNVAGLADLDGDGQPEILFQNVTTGYLAYWVMSGPNLLYSATPRPANPGGAAWKLVAPR
jgi:hypothetical protein